MFFKTIASGSDRARGMGLNEGYPRSLEKPLTRRGECVRYESLEVTEEPSKFLSGKVYK